MIVGTSKGVVASRCQEQLPFGDVDQVGKDGRANHVEDADQFEGVVFEETLEGVGVVCPAAVHFAESVGWVKEGVPRLFI